jgi:putative peptidoglycan lipid II flippase
MHRMATEHDDALDAAAEGAEADASAPAVPAGQGLASAALLMVFVTLVSRIAGMIQIMVIAAIFGTKGDINSFWAAFTIPDLLYFLMAGGAARTAFVPVFTEYIARGKMKEGWRVFSSVFYLLVILGGTIVLLGTVFAPQIARLSALGWLGSEPGRVDVCAHIMRILFPAQLFLVIGGLLMGTLNAFKHFLWPAVGPIVYDVFFIIGAFAAGVCISHGMSQQQALDVMALAVVFGAIFGNVLVQIPPLARRGAKLQAVLDIHDEGVQRVIRLALPVILGLAISEINWVVVRILATMCESDAQSILAYANRLWKLPSGLFAAAIAIAVFPNLSEHYARKDEDGYRRDFSFAMRNTLFMVLPATVAFGVLATPIVRMLYQRHSFGADMSPVVGNVIVWLTPGMFALAINYIVARAFYARHNTVTPVIAGAISFVACIAVGWWGALKMGVLGLALATSVSAVANAGLLMVWLKCQVGRLDGARILRSTFKMIPGCLALTAVCWFGAEFLAARLGTVRELAKFLTVVVPLGLGTVAYIACCAALRAEELTSAWRLVFRRGR